MVGVLAATIFEAYTSAAEILATLLPTGLINEKNKRVTSMEITLVRVMILASGMLARMIYNDAIVVRVAFLIS